jgi:hypothetical protein
MDPLERIRGANLPADVRVDTNGLVPRDDAAKATGYGATSEHSSTAVVAAVRARARAVTAVMEAASLR